MGIFGSLIEGVGSFLGNKQDEAVSVEGYIQIVEALFEELGVDIKDSKIDMESKNDRGWVIRRGSAQIMILISENDEDNDPTIEILSPILKLPSKNILPFYRRCLELNRYLIGCSTCVNEDIVFIRAEMPLGGLDVESVALMICNVAVAADQLDDELAEEFGAKLYDAS
jgi:hypothetical protein